MASNRHLGRIIALQSLYEYEFRAKAGDATAEIQSIIAKNIEPYSKALGDTEFVFSLANGVVENQAKLDRELQPLAPEWPLDTIAAIDRNILRIGLYELEIRVVPPNSSKFINGVLGTAFKQLGLNNEEGEHEGSKSQVESQTNASEQ